MTNLNTLTQPTTTSATPVIRTISSVASPTTSTSCSTPKTCAPVDALSEMGVTGPCVSESSTAINNPISPSEPTSSNCFTNLVVKSVQSACAFYTKVFGWSLVRICDSQATLTYNGHTFHLIAEGQVSEVFGFSALSPQTSGRTPAMLTTLLSEDVDATWTAAISAGAIPVKSPYTKSNGVRCATLVGPENYIWCISSSTNVYC